jgi:hypothetical protein
MQTPTDINGLFNKYYKFRANRLAQSSYKQPNFYHQDDNGKKRMLTQYKKWLDFKGKISEDERAHLDWYRPIEDKLHESFSTELFDFWLETLPVSEKAISNFAEFCWDNQCINRFKKICQKNPETIAKFDQTKRKKLFLNLAKNARSNEVFYVFDDVYDILKPGTFSLKDVHRVHYPQLPDKESYSFFTGETNYEYEHKGEMKHNHRCKLGLEMIQEMHKKGIDMEDGSLHDLYCPRTIEYLVSDLRADVNKKNAKGETPLFCALVDRTKIYGKNSYMNHRIATLEKLGGEAGTNNNGETVNNVLNEN